MIAEFIEWTRPRLPLRVDAVVVNDPIITLVGQGWALTLACPWRLVDGSITRTAWDRPDVDNAMRHLVNHHLVAVRQAPNGFDPIFSFGEGLDLEVSADTDLDPWVMHTMGRTFVGAAH